MNRKYGSIAFIATVVALSANLAFAQVVSAPGSNQVDVTTTPSTNGITPGSSGVVFGTVNISGVGGGTYSLASLPITVSPGSGASTSALSSCQLYNGAGSPITTNANVVNSLSAGSNTFTFDTPLQVNSSTTTLTVKCNVASSAVSGTNFQFVAGLPTFGPGLGIMVNASPSVAAGTTMAPLALITLDGTRSGTPTNVASIPVSVTFNGATPGEFTNCALRNVSNLGNPLNSGTNAVASFPSNGGSQTITLNAPLQVSSGSIQVLALTCDVSPVTPVGSNLTISVNPASLSATNASNGSVLTPAPSVALNGGTAPTIGSVEIVAPGVTTVPGAPNTGAGGEAPLNLAILALTAIVVLGAGKVLLSRRA